MIGNPCEKCIPELVCSLSDAPCFLQDLDREADFSEDIKTKLVSENAIKFYQIIQPQKLF